MGFYLVGLAGLILGFSRRNLTEEARNTLVFASALTGIGFVVLLASTQLGNPRLAQEIQLRTSMLPYVGLAIGVVWLLSGPSNGRQRIQGLTGAIIGTITRHRSGHANSRLDLARCVNRAMGGEDSGR